MVSIKTERVDMMVLRAAAAGLAVFLLCNSAQAAPAQIAGCLTFPPDNIWNAPIDTLPVHHDSDEYISTIGADVTVHPDFGAPYLAGGSLTPIGIPINIVSADQPLVDVFFGYDDESDAGPYPIPENPQIEGILPGGNQNVDGDRHILIVDRDNCVLYEMFYSWPRLDGTWDAGSGAIFDLRSNDLRPDGWTSADAAGLPILPGLIRYDEVLRGEINHAIRFTARNHHIRRAYVWPARHQANSSDDPSLPAMGQRFRLKSDFDISTFSEETQIILRAFKKYGIILADNGSDWFITGSADDRWDNDTLVSEFRRLKGSDFEAVDVSSLMVDEDSGGVSSVVSPPPPVSFSRTNNWFHLLLEE